MKYFRKRKKSRDKSGFLNFHVKERTKFFLASFGESSKNESSQYSLKGKKRKKWKMVEEEKSDSKPSGGDDPSNKPSSSGTGINGPKIPAIADRSVRVNLPIGREQLEQFQNHTSGTNRTAPFNVRRK